MPRRQSAVPDTNLFEILQEGIGQITQEIRAAASSYRSTNVRPDFVFFGKSSDDAAGYLRKLRAFKLNYDLQNEDILRILPRTLKGHADLWYQGLSQSEMLTWDSFQAEFLDKFLPRSKQREIIRQIMNAKQGDREPALDYLYRVKAFILQLLVPVEKDILLDSILKGLLPNYRTAVDPTTHDTIDLLETRLSYLQEIFSDLSISNTKSNGNPNSQQGATQVQSQPPNIKHQNSNYQRQRGLNPNAASFQSTNRNTGQRNSNRFQCGYCKKLGHEERFCYQKYGYPGSGNGPGTSQ